MIAWLTFGTALLGIIGTIVAYEFNPTNQARKKLVEVLKEIQEWEAKRDVALQTNNNDALTIASVKLSGLQHSKASILQQLGIKNSG